MTPEERALLLELYGEEAVERHGIFLANYHRIHALFPPQPPEPIEERHGKPVSTYLKQLFEKEEL